MLLTKNRFSLFFLPSSLFLLLSLSSCVDSANQVCIKNHCINVEVVQKSEELSRGLMFRESLPDDAGMLFVFGRTDIYPFWMKNTLIPLDIIWIDQDVIVDIAPNLPVDLSESPPSYIPKTAANFVLEVNGGFARSRGFKIGDRVTIDLN